MATHRRRFAPVAERPPILERLALQFRVTSFKQYLTECYAKANAASLSTLPAGGYHVVGFHSRRVKYSYGAAYGYALKLANCIYR